MSVQDRSNGFSLAELLLALLILGNIAAFTIPKILSAQQSNTYNSRAKEAAGTLATALQMLRFNGTVSSNTVGADLSPYLNYVKLLTTGAVDDIPGNDDVPCSTSAPCFLEPGGYMIRMSQVSFGGTGTTNAIFINVDPDAVYSGSQTGDSKSVRFYLYYNGMVRTKGDIITNTCNNSSCYNPSSSHNPSWFSW